MRLLGASSTYIRLPFILEAVVESLIGTSIAVGFGWAVDTALPWGYTLVIGMCLLWGIFGVYRTIVQARAQPQDMDLV